MVGRVAPKSTAKLTLILPIVAKHLRHCGLHLSNVGRVVNRGRISRQLGLTKLHIQLAFIDDKGCGDNYDGQYQSEHRY